MFWTNYRFALQAKSLRRENPLSIRVAINTMKIRVAEFPPFPGPYLFRFMRLTKTRLRRTGESQT